MAMFRGRNILHTKFESLYPKGFAVQRAPHVHTHSKFLLRVRASKLEAMFTVCWGPRRRLTEHFLLVIFCSPSRLRFNRYGAPCIS